MPEIDKDTLKNALKEGLREWLDEKFATFGKYSAASVGAMALAGLTYLALIAAGWKK